VSLFAFAVRRADDALVLGHRLSEWTGRAPLLEEELALANLALDLIGQARELYALAGEIAGDGRDEDDLAYLRTDREYSNILLVELPRFHHCATIFVREFCRSLVAGDDDVVRSAGGRDCGEGGEGDGIPCAPQRGMANPAGRRH